MTHPSIQEAWPNLCARKPGFGWGRFSPGHGRWNWLSGRMWSIGTTQGFAGGYGQPAAWANFVWQRSCATGSWPCCGAAGLSSRPASHPPTRAAMSYLRPNNTPRPPTNAPSWDLTRGPERGHSCPQQRPKAHRVRGSRLSALAPVAADKNVRAPGCWHFVRGKISGPEGGSPLPKTSEGSEHTVNARERGR